MGIGKSAFVNEALGRWIKDNPTKSFAIATPDGMYTYKPTFVSHAEIDAERRKQDRLKAMFTFDEAGDIDEKAWELLSTKTKR